jgi:hypothetical protein
MRKKSAIASLILLISFTQCEKEDAQPFVPVDQLLELETISYEGTFSQFVRRSDGGYFICGGATSSVTQPEEMIIFNIGANKNLLWKKAYQVADFIDSHALSICEIEASVYLLAAELRVPGTFDRFIGVMEMDAEGILSAPTHTFPLQQAANWARILRANSGGFFLAYLEEIVIDESTLNSFLIVKYFNSDDVEQWSIKIEDLYWQPDMHIATNGDILIAGSSYPQPGNIQNLDLTAARITSTGQVVYRKSFGGTNESFDVGNSIIESAAGGSIVSGQVAYSNTPVLFSLDEAGNVNQDVVVNNKMYVYKNEVQKLTSGYLITNLFRPDPNVNTQSINLVKVTEGLESAWSYDLEMEPVNVVLINSVTESDGSVTIALVEDLVLKILTTVPL